MDSLGRIAILFKNNRQYNYYYWDEDKIVEVDENSFANMYPYCEEDILTSTLNEELLEVAYLDYEIAEHYLLTYDDSYELLKMNVRDYIESQIVIATEEINRLLAHKDTTAFTNVLEKLNNKRIALNNILKEEN